MGFTEQDKKNLFQELRDIKKELAEFKGKIIQTTTKIEHLEKMGCALGTQRYERSEREIRQTIEKKLGGIKIIAGVSGTIGIIGGVLLREMFKN